MTITTIRPKLFDGVSWGRDAAPLLLANLALAPRTTKAVLESASVGNISVLLQCFGRSYSIFDMRLRRVHLPMHQLYVLSTQSSVKRFTRLKISCSASPRTPQFANASC